MKCIAYQDRAIEVHACIVTGSTFVSACLVYRQSGTSAFLFSAIPSAAT